MNPEQQWAYRVGERWSAHASYDVEGERLEVIRITSEAGTTYDVWHDLTWLNEGLLLTEPPTEDEARALYRAWQERSSSS